MLNLALDRKATTYSRIFEIVRNGYVSPFELTVAPRHLSGCVYRDDGTKVELSERVGGIRGDHVITRNPDHFTPPVVPRRLTGRGVYLGHFMSWHFGHFMFETLSSFWILEELAAKDFDYFVFHPFQFGTDIVELNSFCFARFGIDPAQVVFVGAEPLSFDELYVPERLARLNHSSDPRLRWVYQTVAGHAPGRPAPQRRFYVSRRVFNAKHSHRVVVNEMQIEALFKQAGFEILYPEQLTFPQQVEHCAGAAVMAGLSGSNLFNILFAPPGAVLIEIGDPRFTGDPNPCVPPCASAVGARHHFIPFRGWEFGPRQTLHMDMDHLTAEVEAILLAELPQQDPPLSLRRPALTPSDMQELGYRIVRPTLGHVAQKLRQALHEGRQRTRAKLRSVARRVNSRLRNNLRRIH